MTFSCLKYHFFLEVKIKVTTFVVAKTPCYAFDCSGCSTVGSAPRSGRGGRKFESSHPDCQKRGTDLIHTSFFHAYSGDVGCMICPGLPACAVVQNCAGDVTVPPPLYEGSNSMLSTWASRRPPLSSCSSITGVQWATSLYDTCLPDGKKL